MDVPHGNSLCSYLKQAKRSFFFLSFTKIREQGPVWGNWYQWEREEIEKECGRENIVQILCTHVL
jgi:hypothetical protein